MRVRRWLGGFDLEKLVLELRVQSLKIWEGLHKDAL
jgi:hypothetical protein